MERNAHVTDTTCGEARAFRFGIVAPVLPDVRTWREQVRRIADHGYSTVLMPDFPRLQPAPAAALAVAATVADVRVGTWVYAAPLRAPWLTAWEAHSLTVLTQGRFEMGIGVGRPGIEDELRERGLPVPSPGQRLHQVRETVAALRALDGEQVHTPVAMAVIGPKARAMAAADRGHGHLRHGAERAAGRRGGAGTRLRHHPRGRAVDAHPGGGEHRLAVHGACRTRTLPRCGRPIPSPTCLPTRRRPRKSCAGDVRRQASPTSPSAPTLPTRSLRSSPSWPAGETFQAC